MALFGRNAASHINTTGSAAPMISKTMSHQLQHGPSDSISEITWSNEANPHFLSATSWDKTVRVWEIQSAVSNTVSSQAKVMFQHDAPLLTSCFYQDNSLLFAGGCDNIVKMYDLNSGNSTGSVIAEHSQPICKAAWSSKLNVLVTASWDGYVKMWDGKSAQPVWQQNVQGKIFAMDVKGSILAVADNKRQLFIWNLEAPLDATPLKLTSRLKLQTRSISLTPENCAAKGMAVGSLEGRCSITHFDRNGKQNDFSFKCHRSDDKPTSNSYAVNAVDFHCREPIFATCGSDGKIFLWDYENKQKIRGIGRLETTVADCKFNKSNHWLAYAESYDWHKGPDPQMLNQCNNVYVHQFTDQDFRKQGSTRR